MNKDTELKHEENFSRDKGTTKKMGLQSRSKERKRGGRSTATGREFQTNGAATKNAQRP